MREVDKGPVYKYLESMMTCARVRAFKGRAPPEVSLEPKIIGTNQFKLFALLMWAQFWIWVH